MFVLPGKPKKKFKRRNFYFSEVLISKEGYTRYDLSYDDLYDLDRTKRFDRVNYSQTKKMCGTKYIVQFIVPKKRYTIKILVRNYCILFQNYLCKITVTFFF